MPTKTKYCHGCQAELPIESKQCPYCHQHQQTALEVRVFSNALAKRYTNAPATVGLLIVMGVYFIIITINAFRNPGTGFMDALIAPPGKVIYQWGGHIRGDLVWWRLITANFVHIGLLHIAFNCYALRVVSPYVERTFGSALTLASFVILGTGSMLVSNLLGTTALAAGASGGLMGFIGLAAIAAHREKTNLSLQVRNSMIKWAVATIIFGFALNFSGSVGVDNIAHISGLILGAAAGFILPRQSTTGFTRLWMIRTTRFLAFIALTATILAFYNMAAA